MHKISTDLEKIIKNLSKEEFIFDFLLAYNIPKSDIARVRKWDLNKLEEKWELLLRKKVLFKNTSSNLYWTIDEIKSNLKNNKTKARFIIITDFKKLLSFDTKSGDTLDIKFDELSKYYDFFLPLVWVEKQQYQNENIADVKAANNLAKLFDEIVKDNIHDTVEQRHALNIFLSRLLFCYFAEDTNIFTVNQFTNSLSSHTKVDWSDTNIFLEKLFEIFNTKDREKSLSEYFNIFPYVNGKLFQDVYKIPNFTTKSRKLLINLWELDWSGINPDIFGSMMQAVMDSEQRWNEWSHYTSVPNIMKVINPLFLDELNEEFEECIWSIKKLNALLERISKIKFFDPACWSGNFLIIAYKEIRRLEIEILKEIWVWALTRSIIELSNFYWIELNDFAHETAKLSLYLAEHQMNVEFYQETWISVVSLPLKLWGNIVCWNAIRVDWEEVCPKEEWDEIYLMWNPPYLWASMQNKDQKEDKDYIFKDIKNYKNLDYVSCWFYLASKYIKWINAKFSFVTTNSLNQWEQVSIIWPFIFDLSLEIYFAHPSFKWSNNAKYNAWVVVSIIWIRNILKGKKYIFSLGIKKEVDYINAYLANSSNIIVSKRTKNLSSLPLMEYWNKAVYWDPYILSVEEKEKLILMNNNLEKFIKPLIWAKEFLDSSKRFVIWITDNLLKEATNNLEINKRIEIVKSLRLSSKDKWANKLALTAHKFRDTKETHNSSIIIPLTTSSQRRYIPIWIISNEYIATNAISVIYDEDIWLFWIISSTMHMVWVRTVAWRLWDWYRYSSVLCYNTFPFPYITKKQKEEIEEYVYNILDEREKHSEKTLSDIYNTNDMPEWLKKAHHELDIAIERYYRPKPFDSDEERLEYLFKMYEKMIAKENESK